MPCVIEVQQILNIGTLCQDHHASKWMPRGRKRDRYDKVKIGRIIHCLVCQYRTCPVFRSAGVYLAAQALANDACAVTHLSLEQAHWLAIAGWLAKQGGDLLGGRFYKTKAGGTELESIALRRAPHSDPALLRESFENAQGIGELLLETPEIEAAGGGLKCRIGRSGNIRVYGNEITDPMIDSLLGELEELWENVPAESR